MTRWKITSPSNFPSDRHIKHGSIEYHVILPDWAKNNPKVVIEEIDVVETKEEEIFKITEGPRIDGNFYCLNCEERFLIEKDLQKHFKKAHKYKGRMGSKKRKRKKK